MRLCYKVYHAARRVAQIDTSIPSEGRVAMNKGTRLFLHRDTSFLPRDADAWSRREPLVVTYSLSERLISNCMRSFKTVAFMSFDMGRCIL